MNIKNTLLASAAILAAASSASAIEIKMGNANGSDVGYFRANPHGAFESVIDNYAMGKSTDGTWFGTFCIEKAEFFNPGATYDVALNDGAVSGGNGGAVNGKDIISEGTGWLYEQYAIGAFFQSAFSTLNLQNAIWFLEDEHGWGSLTANGQSLVAFAASSLGFATNDPTWADLKADYTGRNVKVMNLPRNNGTSQHQDQLVYMPVPDTGSTLALLGFATVGLLAYRRRQS